MNLLVQQIIGIPTEKIQKNRLRELSFKLPTFITSSSGRKKLENNQQEVHYDGNDLTTVAEFSRRKKSQILDANSPPRCLLENTKDEKLLMRFVSIKTII
jgi:hypothetical protein